MKAPKQNSNLLVSATIAKSQDIGKEIITNWSALGTFSSLTSLSNILPILSDWAEELQGSSQSILLLGLEKHFSKLGMNLFQY